MAVTKYNVLRLHMSDAESFPLKLNSGAAENLS